jgi:hypothetical protein
MHTRNKKRLDIQEVQKMHWQNYTSGQERIGRILDYYYFQDEFLIQISREKTW